MIEILMLSAFNGRLSMVVSVMGPQPPAPNQTKRTPGYREPERDAMVPENDEDKCSDKVLMNQVPCWFMPWPWNVDAGSSVLSY
jgi:hypothetical protein